ncbi:MAG: histidine--tRNA ligase [Nitrospiraceae bacterium]|nr:histidine--tRNA ligase [Nitrospiraceae bacterium]
MSEQTRVEPRTLKGFQDLLPADLIPRRDVMHAIERIFQKYGFLPVESPAVEHLETLLGTGGDETNKELFTLDTPEEEAAALRFDLTVGFARVLAQYPNDIRLPFRRYAVGPVFRVNKPGPGRFRQFTQLDIDAAGADSVAVDAEIIAIMCEVLSTIGVSEFCVLVNDRKLTSALLDGCGIADQARQKHVLRVIDKLAKVGMDNIRLELGEGRIDESGDPIPGVHLDADTIGRIVDFITVTGATRAEVVENLTRVLPDTDVSADALAEMAELADALNALGIDEAHAKFDPSLARGLDYYTGPVFEAILPQAPEFGSVMGGGRYNQLVERFLDRPVPCTGMGIGIDRLMAVLKHLGVVPEARTTVQVLVAGIGGVANAEILRAAAELRAADICAEGYLAKGGLKKQLKHADRYEIPVAVILGEDEIANGVVSIKDLMAGKRQREGIEDNEAYRKAGKTGQSTVPRAELIDAVRQLLA